MSILDNLEAYLELDEFIDISEDIDKEDIQPHIDRLKSEFGGGREPTSQYLT